jgi:hypothetical protein
MCVEDDGYGCQALSCEINVFEIVKCKFFLLSRRRLSGVFKSYMNSDVRQALTVGFYKQTSSGTSYLLPLVDGDHLLHQTQLAQAAVERYQQVSLSVPIPALVCSVRIHRSSLERAIYLCLFPSSITYELPVPTPKATCGSAKVLTVQQWYPD